MRESDQGEGAADLTRALLGGRLGRYSLGERIGVGGMGEVYVASGEGFAGVRQTFAVKVMRSRAGPDHLSRRFQDEARTAARIHHPNVCAIIDFGEQEEVLYIVMEYLHGRPLSALPELGGGPLPLWLVLRVLADAAHGLHAAHEIEDASGQPLELVHRDVSPHNLMVTFHGPTKVVDFGVAQVRDQLATEAGQVRGKLAYVAPEQLHDEPLDRRADLWSLGVVMHELLSGRRLFKRDTSRETVRATMQAVVPRLSTLRPDLPPALDDLVKRTLVRSPEQRIGSADEIARELEEAIVALGERADHARVGGWLREHYRSAAAERSALVRALREAPKTRVDVPLDPPTATLESTLDSPVDPDHPPLDEDVVEGATTILSPRRDTTVRTETPEAPAALLPALPPEGVAVVVGVAFVAGLLVAAVVAAIIP